MNLKQIFGVFSDKYSAPAECNDCNSPTIPVAIDRDTGAQIVSDSSANASNQKFLGGTGTTTLKSANGSTALDAYAFVVLEDAVFTDLVAPNETNVTNLETPTSYSAGTVVVMDVTQAEVASGTVTFYLN